MTYRYITAAQLATLIKTTPAQISVVDVRDSDYEGVILFQLETLEVAGPTYDLT